MSQLQVDVTPRRSGKTTRALAWLLRGERLPARRDLRSPASAGSPGRPGWNRVLLLPTQQQVDLIAKQHDIEDFERRVLTAHQWHDGRGRNDARVWVDNAEWLLPGNLAGFSVTGKSVGQPASEVLAYLVTDEDGDMIGLHLANQLDSATMDQWLARPGTRIIPLVAQQSPEVPE